MFKRLLTFLNSSANDLEPELNKNLTLSDKNTMTGKVENFTSLMENTVKEVNAAATIGYDLSKLSLGSDSELVKFYLCDWVGGELKSAHSELQALKTRIEALNNVKSKAGLVVDHLNTENVVPFVEYNDFDNGDRYILTCEGDKLICTIKRK